MFFSEELLTNRKGSFGIVWLAATLGPRATVRKITKKQLVNVDLTRTCELIARPPEPMALRLSGALLVGVARVYNQNYELFYSDVTSFHTQLRRSIATDLATSTSGVQGEVRGLDLPGGGKSRLDAITFGGSPLAWDAALDLTFAPIDWSNPIVSSRERRSTSKLNSLSSQASDKAEDEEEDELSSDDEGLPTPLTRSQMARDSASASGPRPRASSDAAPTSSNRQFLEDEFILNPIDLGIVPDENDFPLPDPYSSHQPSNAQLGWTDYRHEGDVRLSTPGQELEGPDHPASTPTKKRAHEQNGDGSQESVEEIDAVLQGERKKKRVRKVRFDRSLEMDPAEERFAIKDYAVRMNKEREEMHRKEAEKLVHAEACKLVDSAGALLNFFDPAVRDFFSTITRVAGWQWERGEVTAAMDITTDVQVNGYVAEAGQHDHEVSAFGPGMDDINDMRTYDEIYHDTMVPMPDDTRENAFDYDTPGMARRVETQESFPSQMPWDKAADDDDFFNVRTSSFSPATLRLSIMTPQELKLRSHDKSGGTAGLRVARSRSGSVLGQRGADAKMLFPSSQGKQEEDDYLETLPLAQPWREHLPEAFRPEMLASLPTSCRNFLTYVENTMAKSEDDEIDFDHLVTFESKKRVAATAFYNVLTLATRKILHVEQPDPWDQILLKFTTTVHM